MKKSLFFTISRMVSIAGLTLLMLFVFMMAAEKAIAGGEGGSGSSILCGKSLSSPSECLDYSCTALDASKECRLTRLQCQCQKANSNR